MFDEAQLYSPVTRRADGSVTVELSGDHPGAGDPVYRARRNEIAAAALDWVAGTPAPPIAYTEAEHEVWRIVSRELAVKHARLACRAIREAGERLALPTDHVPGLDEVSALLGPLTGFRYAPAAGLVPAPEFYGSLADGVFRSTQYVRHPAMPLYTPEPDIIHEVIGHGTLLADPALAELNRVVGRAARRCETERGLDVLGRVFWFSVEFGVVWEGGVPCAYGAGILSSFGEIEEFRSAEIRPLDLAEMGTAEYDITHYQPVLYAAESMDHLTEVVGGFFATFDDDVAERLVRSVAGAG
ncbi:MAG: phenylalanine 4-monooxygenase [Actinomycetota bacterium]